MTPIQFVPIGIAEPLRVFEEKGEIIILNDLGEDVTNLYDIKKVHRGQTTTVVVKIKKTS